MKETLVNKALVSAVYIHARNLLWTGIARDVRLYVRPFVRKSKFLLRFSSTLCLCYHSRYKIQTWYRTWYRTKDFPCFLLWPEGFPQRTRGENLELKAFSSVLSWPKNHAFWWAKGLNLENFIRYLLLIIPLWLES